MGFEPTTPEGVLVFKTRAFDHSATLPYVNYVTFIYNYITFYKISNCIYIKIYIMPILTILITLIIIGLLLWLVNTYIPMDGKIKKILNIVTIIAVIIWLLKVFGVLAYLGAAHI